MFLLMALTKSTQLRRYCQSIGLTGTAISVYIPYTFLSNFQFLSNIQLISKVVDVYNGFEQSAVLDLGSVTVDESYTCVAEWDDDVTVESIFTLTALC